MNKIAKVTRYTLDDEKMCSQRVIFADLELNDGEKIKGPDPAEGQS